MSAAPRTAPLGRCPLCGSAASRPAIRARDDLHGIAGEFEYRRCTGCRTVYQDPRVVSDDLSLVYPRQYYTHARAADGSPARPGASLRDGIRARLIGAVRDPSRADRLSAALCQLRFVRELAFYGLLDELIPRRPGRALEVGCGAGGLLATLTRAGWRAEGIEWDPRAASVAREASKCPVSVGHYARIPLERASYDLVLFHHVIEHLEDPRELFAWLGTVLAPDGVAVLVYPNAYGLTSRVFGEHWHQWDAPRHLWFPEMSALVAALRDHGLAARARTSARTTPLRFAQSRARRARRGTSGIMPALIDRAAGALAGGLERLGIAAGEEVVVVLGHDRGAA